MSELGRDLDSKLVLHCPYCGGKGELKPGDRVWPGKGQAALYVCENHPVCDTYVRCHAGTETPLGTMAGKRLRRLRKIAHDQFDPIWKDTDNELGRSAAYQAAARVMDVQGEFHIGSLDERGCEVFIEHIHSVELEMDRLLVEHAQRGAPPGSVTLEILQVLFHPDRDTFMSEIALGDISGYEREWIDAQRCGLVVQDGPSVRLSPKGRTACLSGL